MKTASTPLGLNSYFTKWKGGYESWKATTTDENKKLYMEATSLTKHNLFSVE